MEIVGVLIAFVLVWIGNSLSDIRNLLYAQQKKKEEASVESPTIED